jgi:hypothetical protein
VTRLRLILGLLLGGGGITGCMGPPRMQFVDVPTPLHSAKVAVISANTQVVRLRVSGPNEPVFLALVEPRVIGDGLYLFPSYISKPTVSERLEVPVVELDLPAEWRDRIYWVEEDWAPRWYQVFANRVRTIERRQLELPLNEVEVEPAPMPR